MGPNRGMSVGMTALANDNATNFKHNEKKNENKRKKEDPWKKEKKRKKEDPWKKPKTHGMCNGANLNQTTHTRNGKRRLRLSAWLTLLVLQVQVQVKLHRARQSTPRNHEPRRNVVCTIAPWHVLHGSVPSPSTLSKKKSLPCLSWRA